MPNGTERATFYGPGGSEYTRTVDVAKGGLTIRDYFAARFACQIMRELENQVAAGKTGYDEHWRTQVATEAYRIADAMLAARKGGVA